MTQNGVIANFDPARTVGETVIAENTTLRELQDRDSLRADLIRGADMTLEAFRLLRGLEDHRVRMAFSDGQVVIATLVSVTVDLDESCHIVYDKSES